MSRNDSIDTFFISFISYVREENKYNFMQNIARNLKNVFFVRIVGSFAQFPGTWAKLRTIHTKNTLFVFLAMFCIKLY